MFRPELVDFYHLRVLENFLVMSVKLSMKVKVSGCNPADELYSIMFKARQELITFVRDIKVLPEPAIILALDYQLDDLVRFATNDDHCVLTIDPTFSLGKFDVTPITYRHLLLESRRSGKPPICIGPILIHYKKTFSSYLFFASSLIGLRKQVKAFGTDGEEALADAFGHEFYFASRLTCVIHKRRNIEAKLKDIGFSVEAQASIIDDIFGRRRGEIMHEGLIDSDSSTFDLKLNILEKKWKKLHCAKGIYFMGGLRSMKVIF